jgi:hypothetical protein
MDIHPKNIRATALILQFMDIKPQSATKDPSLEVKRERETKKGKGIESIFNTPFPLFFYKCNKKGYKAIHFPTKKKVSNGRRNEERDEANCASGYSDIALICNKEIDTTFISLEGREGGKVQQLIEGQ